MTKGQLKGKKRNSKIGYHKPTIKKIKEDCVVEIAGEGCIMGGLHISEGSKIYYKIENNTKVIYHVSR